MKFLNFLQQNRIFLRKSNYFRYYSRFFQQNYKIDTFSNVRINVPFGITLDPLDVHECPQCDEIKIKLTGQSVDSNSIKYQHSGNNVNISADIPENSKDVICNIEVPIKANLNVTSEGSIKTGYFNGSELILTSKNGNIDIGKYEGDIVDIKTLNGNINFNGSIEAMDVKAHILENGSITARKFLTLNLDLCTNKGDISLQSSYADNSKFSTKNGNMTLQNLHKSSSIRIEKGELNLTALDGSADIVIDEGNADIHISRILNDSKIDLKKGDLLLKISENCNDTIFEIIGKIHQNQPPSNLNSTINDNVVYLTPLDENSTNRVRISCRESIDIKTATWSDLFKLKQ